MTILEIILIIALIIGCFGTACYLAFTPICLILGQRANTNSKHWLLTKARVESADFKFVIAKEGTWKTKIITRLEFSLIRTYSYSLQGKKYFSSNVQAGDRFIRYTFKSLGKLPSNKTYLIINESQDGETFSAYEEISNNLILQNGIGSLIMKPLNPKLLEEKAKTVVGETIDVYYNSQKPQQACREKYASDGVVVTSAVFTLIGALLIGFFGYIALDVFLDLYKPF